MENSKRKKNNEMKKLITHKFKKVKHSDHGKFKKIKVKASLRCRNRLNCLLLAFLDAVQDHQLLTSDALKEKKKKGIEDWEILKEAAEGLGYQVTYEKFHYDNDDIDCEKSPSIDLDKMYVYVGYTDDVVNYTSNKSLLALAKKGYVHALGIHRGIVCDNETGTAIDIRPNDVEFPPENFYPSYLLEIEKVST